MLKVVRRNSLSLRMLLRPSRPRIEKVIDTLERSASLPRYFGVLAQRILQLYI